MAFISQDFFLFTLLFETGSHYVALIVLELRTHYVDQAGLELIEICLPLPSNAGIKGVSYHAWHKSVIHSLSTCVL